MNYEIASNRSPTANSWLIWQISFFVFKELRIAKMIIFFYFLAPAQRNWMQPILLPYAATFRCKLQKKKKQQHWYS